MKDAYYFPHDANARNDPKMVALRHKYGAQGYGWFWLIVEMLREASGYRLEMAGYMFRALAEEMGCDLEMAKAFVQDCIQEFSLLQSDGKRFWSESLLRRMSYYQERSAKARHAADVRWGNETLLNAPAMQTHSERIAEPEPADNESTASKAKQSIEKQLDHSSPEASAVDTVDNPPEGEEPAADPCRQFMEHYNEVFRDLWKRPLLLTDGRRTKIKARLKSGFTLADLMQATTNIRGSPYQCGQNPNRQVYATPEFICRSDEKVEEWLKKEVPLIGNPGPQDNSAKRGRYDRFELH